MIKLLIKLFIKDSESESVKREKYGVLGGTLGIICNLLLFCLKLTIGAFMKSIAVISDAFNNLSDCGSSVISIIGAKMSNRRPDKEHPFGHGRIEYISSMLVSFIIILVGVELLKTSFDKIINPQAVDFNIIAVIFLAFSVLIKLWMFSYNRFMGKKINSEMLKAAAADSLNDAISTSAVVISTVAGYFLNWKIDGIIGLAVSILIIISGIKIAKETISILLGQPPEKETVESLHTLIKQNPNIVGIHDLIVHNYGPGRIFASVHAEVPDNCDVIKMHEEIDKLESNILAETGIEAVIHMDPISVNCERCESFKKMVLELLSLQNESFSIHDFRITDGENRINLIFDLVVSCDMPQKKREEIVETFEKDLYKKDPRCRAVIKVENNFI
ncbi:MAG: cation transporter [Ruminococcaceae bacterium]|nr:cation transporter [Oscillospiraceae bacterium]